MKLARFTHEGTTRPGVIVDGEVVDVTAMARHRGHAVPGSLREILAGPGTGWIDELLSGPEGLAAPRHQVDAVRLQAPLPDAGKILAVGRNYRDHVDEADIALPEYPKVFTKFDTTVIGDGDAIVRPTMTSQLDYEVEVAAVIGRVARMVPLEDAMDVVAGYTAANDVSARDIQFSDEQLVLGKNFDTFCPMGPVLTTRDEMPDPRAIGLSLRLNGEVMQESSTAYLIFSIPYIVSFLSYVMTLNPGDVILTGTPSGVGCFRTPPVWLEPGDVVETTVDGVGTLTNHVVDGTGEVPRPSHAA